MTNEDSVTIELTPDDPVVKAMQEINRAFFFYSPTSRRAGCAGGTRQYSGHQPRCCLRRDGGDGDTRRHCRTRDPDRSDVRHRRRGGGSRAGTRVMANFAPCGASFGDLTTLADVKAWLQTGQSAFPATDDALLMRLITAASQFIQTWLNRQITSQDWIEIRDGLGSPLGPYDVRSQFAVFPVSFVSLVVVDGLTIPPIHAS